MGKKMVTHISDNKEGTCCSPATSTEMGATVYFSTSADAPAPIYYGPERTRNIKEQDLTIQNTPTTAPLMTANKTIKSYPSAGIQIVKHNTPQAAVKTPATSIRPNLSLAHPTMGRPTAVPRFRNALIAAACAALRPIDSAKLGNEYRSVMYPSILRNPQVRSSKTS